MVAGYGVRHPDEGAKRVVEDLALPMRPAEKRRSFDVASATLGMTASSNVCARLRFSPRQRPHVGGAGARPFASISLTEDLNRPGRNAPGNQAQRLCQSSSAPAAPFGSLRNIYGTVGRMRLRAGTAGH